jgi:mannose-6-phosphate isomerase-like protein (cupin superfamily)
MGYSTFMRNLDNIKAGFAVLENGSQLQTAAMILEPGHESGPLGNEHPASEQVLYVVDGTVEAEIDGKKCTMTAGDSAIVPRNAPHRFVNRSGKRALTFNVYAPKAY